MASILTTSRLRLALLCVSGLLARLAATQTAPAPALAAPARDLAFYLTQAQQNSPLSADMQNQGRAGQLET